jgi:hypothetical protein
MPRMYTRCDDLDAREIDNEIFLIDEDGGDIHHLNATRARLLRRALGHHQIPRQ